MDNALSYDNLDTLAASAYSGSRDVATAIREDVLPNVKANERPGLKRLRERIERRDIFDERMIVEIEILIDTLSREIINETTEVERYDNDPCNVSPGSWTERHRTERGKELIRALVVLQDFLEKLYAVHDLMHAERAIEKLRQRN